MTSNATILSDGRPEGLIFNSHVREGVDLDFPEEDER